MALSPPREALQVRPEPSEGPQSSTDLAPLGEAPFFDFAAIVQGVPNTTVTVENVELHLTQNQVFHGGAEVEELRRDAERAG